MARLMKVAILFASGWLMSLPGIIADPATAEFSVQGEVYCDVCRVDFVNKFSERMAGATVRLECKDETSGTVKYSVEGLTDEKGAYTLPVQGDHELDVCDVVLVQSSRPDCSELPKEGWARFPSSRVDLASNTGIPDKTRHANPLSFFKKEAEPKCAEVQKELQADLDRAFILYVQ